MMKEIYNLFFYKNKNIVFTLLSALAILALIVLLCNINLSIKSIIFNIVFLFFLFNINNCKILMILNFLFLSICITPLCISGILYSCVPEYGMIASVIETDINEAIGFIMNIKFYNLIFFVFIQVILFYIIKMSPGLKNKGYIVLCILLLFNGIYPHLPITERSKMELKNNPVEFLLSGFNLNMIISVPLKVVNYYYGINKIKNLLGSVKEYNEGIIYKNNDNIIIPHKIVLVIGESDSKYHHASYGYSINTDPFIKNICDSKNGYKFNAISPASITRESCIRFLSFANGKSIDKYYSNENLIDILKNAGYYTHWISSQQKVGQHDTLISAIALSSDSVQFVNTKYDIELCNNILIEKHTVDKNFYFIHIKGSHIPYNKRYELIDYNNILNSEEQFKDYDASIKHTDRFLEKITSLFDDNTLFIYLSDHGEIVNKGHGFPSGGKTQYEIPLYCWSYNSYFIERFKSLVYKYSFSNNSIFNISSIPFVISEIVGYSVNNDIVNKSVNESVFVYEVDGKSYDYNKLE